MARGTTVVALGGNAFAPEGDEPEEVQARNSRRAMAAVAESLLPSTDADDPRSLVLVHGNGPQVGASLLRQEGVGGEGIGAKLAAGKGRAAGEAVGERVATLSLAGHVAATQGSMGYLLETALREVMAGKGGGPRRLQGDHAVRGERPEIHVATLITLVEIDPDDPALRNPTKPIGPYYTAERARELERERGWHLSEDSGRGWRRLVASPRPLRVCNDELVARLLAAGAFVVAGGGGGIPVVPDPDDEGGLRPVPAVIDKDRTAVLLAGKVDADSIVFLNPEDCVYLDYGTDEQRRIPEMTPEAARRHQQEGQFPPGSMGPKVEAATRFVEESGGFALITSIDALADAVAGRAGTRIRREE